MVFINDIDDIAYCLTIQKIYDVWQDDMCNKTSVRLIDETKIEYCAHFFISLSCKFYAHVCISIEQLLIEHDMHCFKFLHDIVFVRWMHENAINMINDCAYRRVISIPTRNYYEQCIDTLYEKLIYNDRI